MEPDAPAKGGKKRIERYLALAATLAMMVTALLGMARSHADLEPFLFDALPEAAGFKPLENGTFAGYTANPAQAFIGYVKISEADGYGGPLKIAVASDQKGVITGVVVIEQRETPHWFERVNNSDLIKSLNGKSFRDEFKPGNDVDVVSGASYTCRAVLTASRTGIRSIAASELNLPVPKEKIGKVVFGVPELVLVLLIMVWFLGSQERFLFKKQARWATLLTGMIVLGFLYTRPLTLPFLTRMLMGFWPGWQSSLYWYGLLGFFLMVLVINGKNPYCQWICPFGAVQETLGLIGGAKSHHQMRVTENLRWLQRGLALFAVLAALLFRNPGISSYEVFGTFFDLEGSAFQFGLLGLVLIASFLIKRPWCRFLCPIGATYDFLRILRSWIKEIWQSSRKSGRNQKNYMPSLSNSR